MDGLIDSLADRLAHCGRGVRHMLRDCMQIALDRNVLSEQLFSTIRSSALLLYYYESSCRFVLMEHVSSDKLTKLEETVNKPIAISADGSCVLDV